MSDKLTFISPEPIQLLEGDQEGSTDDLVLPEFVDENGIRPGTSTSVHSPKKSRRRDPGFVFLKAFVGNSTMVSGDDGNKYMVWKVTIVLKPPLNDDQRVTISPKIEVFRRYSDFVTLRNELVEHVKRLKQENIGNSKIIMKIKNIQIPDLPPRVPWYDLWQYNDVNLDSRWLLKRRRGLEYFLNYVLLDKYIVEFCRETIRSFL